MRQRPLFWQVFLGQLFITLLILLIVGLYSAYRFRDFNLTESIRILETRAYFVADFIEPIFKPDYSAELQLLCQDIDQTADTRISIILPNGVVIADSRYDPTKLENHANRPEIKKAYQGLMGAIERYSTTLEKDMLYVAVPYQPRGDSIVAVIRTSIPLTSIKKALNRVYFDLFMGAIGVAMAMIWIHLIISRRITRVFNVINEGLENYANGAYEFRFPRQKWREIDRFTQAFNRTADQLKERIQRITRQKNEQEALFSSMMEGVLAVDLDGNVIKLNQKAGSMFGFDPDKASGRPLVEVIPNLTMQRFVRRVLDERRLMMHEIVYEDVGNERYFEVHGAVLQDAKGKEIGVLAVIQDVTNVRRLENVRRDFVANVSHELKTPISAIMGAIETLRDGAIENPEDAKRFMKIINRHSKRMAAIVDDLLVLSRMEVTADSSALERNNELVYDIILTAVYATEFKANKKNIDVTIDCPEDLMFFLNRPLMEQALINLVQNAIRYSDKKTDIQIKAGLVNNELLLSVKDNGIGIADEHLPRIFERFYRVDKARSRKLGGTGLGLAIVKHIVLAHRGQITVESQLEEGSIFTIRIPANHFG